MSIFNDQEIVAKSAETIVMDWLTENVEFSSNFYLDCINYIKCIYKVRTTGNIKIINKDIKDFCGGMIIFESSGQFSCSGCKCLEDISDISLTSPYVNLTGCESLIELPDFMGGTVIICDDCSNLKISEKTIKQKKWVIIGSGYQIIHDIKQDNSWTRSWIVDDGYMPRNWSLSDDLSIDLHGNDSINKSPNDYILRKIHF